MSAKYCLAGMFPSQKVPVNSVPPSQEYLLSYQKPCDKFTYEMLKFENTSAYTELFEKYKPIIKYMEKHTGQKLHTIKDILYVIDSLDIEHSQRSRYAKSNLINVSTFI